MIENAQNRTYIFFICNAIDFSNDTLAIIKLWHIGVFLRAFNYFSTEYIKPVLINASRDNHCERLRLVNQGELLKHLNCKSKVHIKYSQFSMESLYGKI
jgi:hypothetical protein